MNIDEIWNERLDLTTVIKQLDIELERGAIFGNRRSEMKAALLEQLPGKLVVIDKVRGDDFTDGVQTSQMEFMSVEDFDILDKVTAGIPKQSLSYVYLDADTTYADIELQLETFWPLLKSGGVIAGNGFIADGWHMPDVPFAVVPEGTPKAQLYGVKGAVVDFVADNQLRLYVTSQRSDRGYQNWLLVKP